jgi:hypothetical protein
VHELVFNKVNPQFMFSANMTDKDSHPNKATVIAKLLDSKREYKSSEQN